MSSKQLKVTVRALGPRKPKKPENWKPPKRGTAEHQTLHAKYGNGVKLPDALY